MQRTLCAEYYPGVTGAVVSVTILPTGGGAVTATAGTTDADHVREVSCVIVCPCLVARIN